MNVFAIVYKLLFTVVFLGIAVYIALCVHTFGLFLGDHIFFYKYTWPYLIWVFSCPAIALLFNCTSGLSQVKVFEIPWVWFAGLIPVCLPKLNKFSVAAPTVVMIYAFALLRVILFD